MFLALREIRHQPRRFALIVTVIALVAYVTFFLSSLSYGLGHAFSAASDKWGGADVVMSTSANGNINASRLTDDQVAAGTSAGGEALLLTASVASATGDGAGAKKDVYAFGIDQGSGLWPVVTAGAEITDPSTQVIADDSLERDGWAVGDTFKLGESDQVWTISGFTHDSTYVTAPVLYVDRAALIDHGPIPGSAAANALVTPKGTGVGLAARAGGEDLQSLDASQFVNSLSGYSAQMLTFNMMIGALIGITSLVLAIFIYVLTLQKRDVLGVLKAQGVPTRQLIWSGVVQTVLLAAVGIVIGAILTAATDLVLPAGLPFRIDWGIDALIVAAFIIFAVLGGLVSVRSVANIDPVEAIS